jgi:hypothetical protein
MEGLTERVSRLLLNPSLSEEVGKHNEKAVQEIFGIASYRNQLDHYMAEVKVQLQSAARPTPAASQTLLHSPSTLLIRGSDPTVYLLHDGVRYPFPSEPAFKSWHYKFEKVIPVSDAVNQSFTLGEPVKCANIKVKRKKTKRIKHIVIKLKSKGIRKGRQK